MAYHIIPYNFEKPDCDFGALFEEESGNNKGIRWHYGNKNFNIDYGDICFIYCTNLPDMTKRILLKATVTQIECWDNEDRCFELSDFKAIKLTEPQYFNDIEGDINDKITYSLKQLNKYDVFSVQGKRHLKNDNSKHQQLVNLLNNDTEELGLKDVKEYFESITQCALANEEKEHNHHSFTKPNGLTYYETHHLIQQKLLSDEQIPDDVIDNPKNKFYLCPACHCQIHYGKKKDIRDMLKKLYDQEETFITGCFNQYANKEADDALRWLYKIYDVTEET